MWIFNIYISSLIKKRPDGVAFYSSYFAEFKQILFARRNKESLRQRLQQQVLQFLTKSELEQQQVRQLHVNHFVRD